MVKHPSLPQTLTVPRLLHISLSYSMYDVFSLSLSPEDLCIPSQNICVLLQRIMFRLVFVIEGDSDEGLDTI